MRYVIYNPKKLGGVTRVSEDLYEGMTLLGHKVMLETSVLRLLCRCIVNRDTIYITCLHAFIVNLFARRSLYILHGWPTSREYNFLSKFLLLLGTKLGSYFATKTIAVSNLTRITNYVQFGIKSDEVIHNPTTLHSFSLRLDREKIILFCGKLVEGKGVVEIIDAFQFISKEYPEYRLKMIGSGKLSNLVSRNSQKNKIEYCGEVRNRSTLSQHFESADIFISLNEAEPFGIVFLEAMAAKLKIICPVHGGQIEFIPKNYPCFRVSNSYSIDAIVQSMREAIEAERDTSQFDVDLERFTPISVASNYVKICGEL